MYREIPLSLIVIDREERQRRELPGIPELASSIRQIGLINPVVITEDFVLIAGERRLEACRSIGWDTIPTITKEDLAPHQLQLLELEENIKRLELPWKDECHAIARYHRLRCEADEAHTQEATAAELSISLRSLQSKLAVAKELESGNDLVVAADKFTVAANIVSRAAERKAAAEAETITRILAPAQAAPADDPLAEVLPEPITAATSAAPLLNIDFHEWAPAYSGPRFNFLHCDFPYGVNADKHHQGAAKYYRGYEDSPDVYWTLISALGENLERIVADSAHLIFWYSMDYHHETKMALQQMGWKVNPFPLIWHKSDNTGILPDPQRGPRRIYETAFFASRGDRKIVQAVGNCFAAPVTKTIHMSQKSLPMLKHFFRMVVDEHTLMLDPTCGSASAVQAAHDLGAGEVLGLEKNPEFFERAVEEWKEAQDNVDPILL